MKCSNILISENNTSKVVERHFTLDNSLKGSDHKCSLNPEKFAEMVKSIRTMELALGSPQKMFLPCENACFAKLGKSVVAGQNLSEGTIINLEHLKIKVRFNFSWAWQPKALSLALLKLEF